MEWNKVWNVETISGFGIGAGATKWSCHPPRHRLHNAYSAVSHRIEDAQAGYFGEELAEHLQPNLVVGWLVEGLSEKINWRLGPSEKMRKRFSRAHTQLFEQGKQ